MRPTGTSARGTGAVSRCRRGSPGPMRGYGAGPAPGQAPCPRFCIDRAEAGAARGAGASSQPVSPAPGGAMDPVGTAAAPRGRERIGGRLVLSPPRLRVRPPWKGAAGLSRRARRSVGPDRRGGGDGRARCGAGGTPRAVRGGGVSKSATKAPRAGIDRENKRGISTIFLWCASAIGAFVADLDNRPSGRLNERPEP